MILMNERYQQYLKSWQIIFQIIQDVRYLDKVSGEQNYTFCFQILNKFFGTFSDILIVCYWFLVDLVSDPVPFNSID